MVGGRGYLHDSFVTCDFKNLTAAVATVVEGDVDDLSEARELVVSFLINMG